MYGMNTGLTGVEAEAEAEAEAEGEDGGKVG